MKLYGILCLWLTVVSSSSFLRGYKVFNSTRWYIENKKIMLEERGASVARVISLRGLTWQGLDTDALAPYGMWKHSQEFFLDQLRIKKFNAIRVLFSAEWVYYHWDAFPNPCMIYNDIEARNKSSVEILDMLMEKTRRKNLVMILAMGRLHKDFLTDIWFHYPEYPISVFKESWFRILDRYRHFPHIMGIDLFNEPHGMATMSGIRDDPYDWIFLVTDTIETIERRYPSNPWLYMVQGIVWGGVYNISLVETLRQKPYADRIIYTPHIIDRQETDLYKIKTPVRTMFENWDKEFGFIANNNDPVMITRCNSFSTIWTGLLGDYVVQNQMTNVFLWQITADPAEGIFEEDWSTIRPDRIMVLDSIQPNITRTIFANP